ncbi:MAG: 2'-5' RNA ligase family protein [Ignavibacteriales bacterium]|nr:2'-5' RNA ligase family protein [Ignavibacteriales bacterium]
MALLVVAYPAIEKKDYDWVQSIRAKNDDRYFNIIEPHFTIVFPVFDLDEKIFIDHVEKAAKRFKTFYFVLRCAQIVKNSFSSYTDVFLIPEEGYRIFVKLHDAFYSGPLEKDLRLDIPFIPHLGIANSEDSLHSKKIADEINSNNLEILGAVNNLDIISYENNKVRTVHKIFLE